MIAKFRVWNNESGMYDVTWLNFDDNEVGVKRESDGYIDKGKFKSNEVIIMQSTGFLDKNNIEIFEGDIIKGKYEWFRGLYEYPVDVIDYTGGTFFADIYHLYEYEEIEILGNVYENPELLEVEE